MTYSFVQQRISSNTFDKLKVAEPFPLDLLEISFGFKVVRTNIQIDTVFEVSKSARYSKTPYMYLTSKHYTGLAELRAFR